MCLKIQLLCLLFYVTLCNGEGFLASTKVKTECGNFSIEHLTINDYLISYGSGAAWVTAIIRHQINSYIKVHLQDVCIGVAPDQKFLTAHDGWVAAEQLVPTQLLVTLDNQYIPIDQIEIVNEQVVAYALTVEPNHTFSVSHHELVVHNVAPFIVIAAKFVFDFGVFATVEFVGASMAAGIAGLGAYFGIKALHSNTHDRDIVPVIRLENEGCFKPDDNANQPQICITPFEEPKKDGSVPCPGVDSVTWTARNVVSCPDITAMLPSIESGVYILPIEPIVSELIHTAEAVDVIGNKQHEESKGRYDGPTYHRTEDWIVHHPFGQLIQDALARSDYVNQGKRAFEVTKKLDNCEGFDKGDYVVIDAQHKDHLEVFNAKAKWTHVANFDGTKNHEKTKQGQQTKRAPLKKV
jgi:hypothetical protein